MLKLILIYPKIRPVTFQSITKFCWMKYKKDFDPIIGLLYYRLLFKLTFIYICIFIVFENLETLEYLNRNNMKQFIKAYKLFCRIEIIEQ